MALDANRAATASLQNLVEDAFRTLRSSIEENAMKVTTEANRLDARIAGITRMCDDLPLKMTECENLCIGANTQVVQLKKQVSTLTERNYSIDAKKLDIAEQEIYAKRIYKQL